MTNKLAIFDIDGVLADDRHRVHYALDKQWYAYFDEKRMAADDVWPQGREYVRVAEELGYVIAYMTGRRQDRRDVTEGWLDYHGFPMGRVIMRTTSDTMPLANFKLKRMNLLAETTSYDDMVLFDDDPEVIRVVGEVFGGRSVMWCTWHKKEKALIKAATA